MILINATSDSKPHSSPHAHHDLDIRFFGTGFAKTEVYGRGGRHPTTRAATRAKNTGSRRPRRHPNSSKGQSDDPRASALFSILTVSYRNPALHHIETAQDGDRGARRILETAAPFQKFQLHSTLWIWGESHSLRAPRLQYR